MARGALMAPFYNVRVNQCRRFSVKRKFASAPGRIHAHGLLLRSGQLRGEHGGFSEECRAALANLLHCALQPAFDGDAARVSRELPGLFRHEAYVTGRE